MIDVSLDLPLYWIQITNLLWAQMISYLPIVVSAHIIEYIVWMLAFFEIYQIEYHGETPSSPIKMSLYYLLQDHITHLSLYPKVIVSCSSLTSCTLPRSVCVSTWRHNNGWQMEQIYSLNSGYFYIRKCCRHHKCCHM